MLAAGRGVAQAQCVGRSGSVDDALQQQLTVMAEAHHGKVALYATQLNTGKTVAIDADEPVQTASVIKLTILFEAMERGARGQGELGREADAEAGRGGGRVGHAACSSIRR